MSLPLVLVHGWGYDREFWTLLREALAPRACLALDLGYTGEPDATLPDGPFLAVTHSAGTPWVLGRAASRCRMLLAINGFACFTRRPDAPDGVAPRILDRMIGTLGHDPSGVLSAFRARLGEEAPGPSHLVRERLHDGLLALRDEDRRAEAFSLGAGIHRLHGTEDQLVTDGMARRGFAPSSRLTLMEGGHLLPLTRPGEVARWIQSTVATCA